MKIPSILKPILFLLLLLPATLGPVAVLASSPTDRMAAFYAADLHHSYFLPRVAALAGLGHLGAAAADEVPAIGATLDQAPVFERLLGLWALARIGTADALKEAKAQAGMEKARLLEGKLAVQAARVAFLATLSRAEDRRTDLDQALPALYTAARKGSLEGRLLAAWALYAIGAPVTTEVADGAMRSAAVLLDPSHGNYTRHLALIRLVGPPAAPFMIGPLERIAREHDFGADLFGRRARTLFTLAVLTSPRHPLVRDFRRELPARLHSFLDRSQALEETLILGPYACSPPLVDALKVIAGRGDENDRKAAGRCLEICR